MSKRRNVEAFNIAFLDLLTGALGAVIILYIAVPKNKVEIKIEEKKSPIQKESPVEKKVVPDLTDTVNRLSATNESLQSQLDSLKKKQEKLIQENDDLKKKEKETKEVSPNSGKDVDVGFNFRGKYIVFVIDVSGSMHTEDRIGQVKAGLKMLITSMGEEFYIDVIHFPHHQVSDYRPLWGFMKKTTDVNKSNIYNFLQNLKPYGATPTRSVLKYVLQNYNHATDIVLLSDGAPTKTNSKEFDDIESVLKEVSYYNGGRIQINTIGVGSDFIKNKSNPKYQFLKKLSEQNSGFFVGF